MVQDFGFGEIHDSKRKEDRKKDKIIKKKAMKDNKEAGTLNAAILRDWAVLVLDEFRKPQPPFG